MRPIDADYIKSKLNKAALGGHLHYYVCGVIDDAPTIDAKPVKHGRWIRTSEPCATTLVLHCSECGRNTNYDFSYCSNCGAKMDNARSNARACERSANDG